MSTRPTIHAKSDSAKIVPMSAAAFRTPGAGWEQDLGVAHEEQVPLHSSYLF